MFALQSFLAFTLPKATNAQSFIQEQGASLLIIAMIVLIVFFAFKREWGVLIGMVVIIAILIIIVNKPEETIMEWVQGFIDTLMGTGG